MRGRVTEDACRRAGEPRPQAPHGPAVRLVRPERRLVTGLVGQPVQLRGDGDQPRRHRQLPLEDLQFGEMVFERGLRCAVGGTCDHVGGDVRVAVAVAADPRAGPQHRLGEHSRIRPAAAQRIAQFRIDPRHHLEQGRVVVPQSHLDLVLDPQARQPDQRRLPQGEDLPPQLPVDGVCLGGIDGHPLPPPHQFHDPVLGLENRPSARFGGMSGDDWCDEGTRERTRSDLRIHRCGIEFRVGGREGAVLRRFACPDVDRPPAFTVDVLGDVRKQREVTEGTNDRDRVGGVDGREELGQLGPVDLRPADPERLDTGSFDQVEDVLAGLLADDVAEDPAEEADVVTQRLGGGARRADVTEEAADESEVPVITRLSADGRSPAQQRRDGVSPSRSPSTGSTGR